MSRKVRFLKNAVGRHAGHVETNDDDLAAAWQKAGLVEYVDDDAPAQLPPAVEEAAVDAPPVNRSMKGKAKTK